MLFLCNLRLKTNVGDCCRLVKRTKHAVFIPRTLLNQVSCRWIHKFGGEVKPTGVHKVYRLSTPPLNKITNQPSSGDDNQHAHIFLNIKEYINDLVSKLKSIYSKSTNAMALKECTDRDNSARGVKLVPPSSVKGMKVLNRDAFSEIVHIPGFYCPSKQVGIVSKALKTIMFKVPGMKPIVELDSDHQMFSSHKLFLIHPEKISSIEDLSVDQRELLDSNGVNHFKFYEFEMGYKNWTHQEILKAVLPDESDGIAGFSTIGHIIHVNLRNEVLDYKDIIGQVLLDKVPTARTVVNKTNVIDNTFRNFQMELIAGDAEMVTTTKESGLIYELDFSKVYWNPRLGTEHQRIVSMLNKSDVVYDVFAGIGPFAVPAAKKGCTVYANDLNPESYKWLQKNMKINKVKGQHKLYNLDGREFIRTVIKDSLLDIWMKDSDEQCSFHIVMNLPALAVQFLDAFNDLFSGVSLPDDVALPTVHCYSFSKEEDAKTDMKLQAEAALGSSLPTDHTVRLVRNVAPNKDMLCVDFVLTKEVLLSDNETNVDAPPEKKQKTNS